MIIQQRTEQPTDNTHAKALLDQAYDLFLEIQALRRREWDARQAMEQLINEAYINLATDPEDWLLIRHQDGEGVIARWSDDESTHITEFCVVR